ncbi:MAG: hypothetical protein ACKVVT_19730 [Dehalococcoidia bacterium]
MALSEREQIRQRQARWAIYAEFQAAEARTRAENLETAFRMMALGSQLGWLRHEETPTEGDLRWLELKRRSGCA